MILKYWKQILAFVIVVGLTLSTAWYLWKPKKVPDNKPAESVVQSDGSVVLEKKPDANHKPTHKIPKGGVVEREISVTVQPTKPPVNGKCPPVTVDLSLVRGKDRTKRVVASSKDGDILAGIDIPVEDAIPLPEPKLWAAGVTVDPFNVKKNIGIFVDRDIAWGRVGLEGLRLERDNGKGEFLTLVKFGIRF